MKKLTALILAMLLCITLLSGCGGNQGGSAPELSNTPEQSDAPEQFFEAQLREQLTLVYDDFTRFYGSFNFIERDEMFLFNFENVMSIKRSDQEIEETVKFLEETKTKATGEVARLCDEACSLYSDTDNYSNMSRREYVDFLQRLYLYTDSLCEYLDIPFPYPADTISVNYLPVTEEVIHAAQEGDYFDEAKALLDEQIAISSDFNTLLKENKNKDGVLVITEEFVGSIGTIADRYRDLGIALAGLNAPMGYEEAQPYFDEAAEKFGETADLIERCYCLPIPDDFSARASAWVAVYKEACEAQENGELVCVVASSLPGTWRCQDDEHYVVFYLGKAYIATISYAELSEDSDEFETAETYTYDDGVYTFTVEGMDPFWFRKYVVDRASEMTYSINGNTIIFTPTGDGRSFEMTYDSDAKTLSDSANDCVYTRINS